MRSVIARMFALCRPKHQGSTPRGTPGNFGPNWPTPCWFERRRHSIANAAEWLQIAQRSQYRKPPSLFRMVPSLTPYYLPFPQSGIHMPPRYANRNISATGDPIHFMLVLHGIGFSGSADRMAPFLVIHQIQDGGRPPSWKISNGHISATFRSIHLYSAHRAVIFAIAQLSCFYDAFAIYASFKLCADDPENSSDGGSREAMCINFKQA